MQNHVSTCKPIELNENDVVLHQRELEVEIRWSEKNQKWLMFKDGFFIYDFWNCENFNKLFGGLDKDRHMKFQLTIRNISDFSV